MNSDALLALFLSAFFLTVLALSFTFPLQSALLPGLSALFGFSLCILTTVREVVAKKHCKISMLKIYSATDLKKIFGFVFSVLILYAFGFELGGFIFTFLYLIVIGKVPLLKSFILATATPIFIIVVFGTLLQMETYSGLVVCVWSPFPGDC